MARSRGVKFGAGLLALIGLAGSVVLSTAITASAGRNRLVYTDRAEDGDPPQVALGVAMGAFRGLFVNFLWIRANDLKEDGKYHEAVDLASTITKLQPRFPQVWAFHAWNLAYNISVATNTPEERWQWVQSGIRLLRDEAIPANPNDLLLHKELAWLHLHKVQGHMDDAHMEYKRRFAREWTIVLGAPPQRTGELKDTEVAVLAFADRLERIRQAPDTLSELREQTPRAGGLADELQAIGVGLDIELLEYFEVLRAAERIYVRAGVSSVPVPVNPQLNQWFLDMQQRGSVEDQEGMRELLRFVRKRVLIDDYNMEPDRMVRYTLKYGPLDWRHPASHAVYWSTRGVEMALLRYNEDNEEDFDFLNTDRLTIQAIQELYRHGTIIYSVTSPRQYMQMPCLDWPLVYGNIMDELYERAQQTSARRFENRARLWSFYSAGYENFLTDVIRYYFRRGDIAQAEFMYEKLRTFDKLNENNPDLLELYSQPLDRFVQLQIRGEEFANQPAMPRFNSPNVAQEEVHGALWDAYYNGLVNQNPEVFRSAIEYARQFHTVYMDKQLNDTSISEQVGESRMEIMDRDFDVEAGRVLASMIMTMGMADGAIVYRAAPPGLQLHAYRALFGWSAQLDEEGNLAMPPQIAQIYPEPAGWNIEIEMQRIRTELQSQIRMERK